MTKETFEQLKQYKPLWEFFYKNFYLTADHNIHGLAEWMQINTGHSTNTGCSGCVSDLIKMARNIYEEQKHNYEPK